MRSKNSCNRSLIRAMVVAAMLTVPTQFVSAQLNLALSNSTVGTMIKQIQSQSKYRFFYDDEVESVPVEAVNVKDASINEVLEKALAGKDISYRIDENVVYLSKRESESSSVKQEGKRTKQVSGRIVDANGEPLIGVSVLEKGTTNGTITDFDGNYTLTVPENATLQFSYIGYKSTEMPVSGQASINLTMREDSEILDEVVVTALGIKRAEKALSYNVQEVKSDAITTNKDVNFVNALSGKVAGVNINASSSGVGGISKVVMRGTKSIMQSSNALYVIDGVPMFTGRSSEGGGTEFDSKGSSEPIADINPEDIESMSVLTGAAAAALYGSDAANGAIVITTKKGKEGKLSITVSSNTEFSTPFVMPEFQNRYGTGTGGAYSISGDRSWGARLTADSYYGYDPKNDYFQTGIIGTESVSLSTGTEKNQTYASAAAVNSKGIVPNNKYNRYNFAVRNTTSFLNDKMKLDIGASYVLQNDRNMTNQGVYNNPIVGAYIFPRGNDWEDIRMYERYDPARKIYTQYWPVGDAGMTMQNPYWINYRNLRENKKDRYMLNAGLSYEILDWLSVSGRVRLDNSTNDYTEKFYASTNDQLTEGSSRGLYSITRTQDKQLYADFLVNINKTFGTDWSLSANIGASISDVREDAVQVRGPIADGTDKFSGEPVGLTNWFNIQNLSSTSTRLQTGYREQTQSIFASAEIGYKSTYYLTLTGRNDWPSQLAGPKSTSKSFFYPSVGASVLLSELMPNLNKDYLSYLKIRGSWASVGTPFQRYLANPRYEWNGNQWSITTQYPMYNLKPERTESFEVGLTMRFLKNFDLDVTYYNAKTKNQTFNPRLSVSGYSAIYIQTGAVRNQGVELSLNYQNTWNKFTWDTGFTYSMNRNKILTLADNAVNPATGEIFSVDQLDMGGLGEARFLLREGGTMGDLYSQIDLARDDQGRIYVDQNGNVATQTISDPKNYIKLGSVLPKGNLAWRNNFSWNNFNLGFMISARLGGVVFSRTQAILDYYGVSEATASARDLGYVGINDGGRIAPENWYNVVAAGTAVPQYYTYSATNVRLQEVSFGYTFPRKMLRDICDIRISLVGRNLWMIYNKAPFDPEAVASTDNFYQGIDYFMMPALRNIGVNVSFKF